MTNPDDIIARARRGVPLAVLQKLLQQDEATFKATHAEALGLAEAEADATVAEALFDMVCSGRHPNFTLVWARQRLGWRDEVPTHEDPSDIERSQRAAAALYNLLEQLAAAKSGCGGNAAEVADSGAAQPAASSIA